MSLKIKVSPLLFMKFRFLTCISDPWPLRGQGGGVDREFFWNIVFCVYLIEGSQGYHQLFTESKNIAPSPS